MDSNLSITPSMGAGGLLIQAFMVAESQSTTDVSRPFAAPSRRGGAQDTAVKWIGRVYRIQLAAHSPRAGRVLHQQQGRIDARRRIAHRRRRRRPLRLDSGRGVQVSVLVGHRIDWFGTVSLFFHCVACLRSLWLDNETSKAQHSLRRRRRH